MGVNNLEYRAIGMPQDATLDSNLRFFGGLWLGFGLTVVWLVPRVARPAVRPLFTALVVMLWLGGVGRLLSMLFLGAPAAPAIGATALELVGMPLVLLWQYRLSGAKETT
jgi:hypothetical protein